MNITIKLIGTTPLLMHNPRMADPEFRLTREMQALTSKRKKTDEDLKNIEKLEWLGGVYEERGIIVQPTSKVRKCLIETAKRNKLGKALAGAVSFTSLNVPLTYEGPKGLEELYTSGKYTSRLSVVVSNKRIMRVRPQFFPWALSVDGVFIEDAGVNLEDLERIVELAGAIEGIGDGRSIGYGKFEGELIHE